MEYLPLLLLLAPLIAAGSAGTTTTTESLFMGVPVITLSGRCHAHNVSASLLAAVGLADEWVAGDQEEYVQLAVQHANNIPALQQLRQQLRQQMLLSRMCDAVPFVAALEDTYEDLWMRWQQQGGRQRPLLASQQQQQQQQETVELVEAVMAPCSEIEQGSALSIAIEGSHIMGNAAASASAPAADADADAAATAAGSNIEGSTKNNNSCCHGDTPYKGRKISSKCDAAATVHAVAVAAAAAAAVAVAATSPSTSPPGGETCRGPTGLHDTSPAAAAGATNGDKPMGCSRTPSTAMHA
jgi:hypothetical protein